LSVRYVKRLVNLLPRGELKRRIAASLRRHHIGRRKRNKIRRKPGSIQNYLSIEERPKEIAERIVPGHWEGDFIVGRAAPLP